MKASQTFSALTMLAIAGIPQLSIAEEGNKVTRTAVAQAILIDQEVSIDLMACKEALRSIDRLGGYECKIEVTKSAQVEKVVEADKIEHNDENCSVTIESSATGYSIRIAQSEQGVDWGRFSFLFGSHAEAKAGALKCINKAIVEKGLNEKKLRTRLFITTPEIAPAAEKAPSETENAPIENEVSS